LDLPLKSEAEKKIRCNPFKRIRMVLGFARVWIHAEKGGNKMRQSWNEIEWMQRENKQWK